MYVCFGFWWWACLPLPEKGRWVGRRVRRVNLERALSRSNAPRVCPAECPLGSGLGDGGAAARVGFWFGAFFVPWPGSIQNPSSSPLSSVAPIYPPASFLFFAFRHLDLHPVWQPDGIVAMRRVGNPSGHVWNSARPTFYFLCVSVARSFTKNVGRRREAHSHFTPDSLNFCAFP